ncbi:MAG: DM13 domain-containing protein [Leptolyngbya sp. RL_3_1]|nr:DM13 domain-containing protein [Leptolyngbya sp. RL_3_1]
METQQLIIFGLLSGLTPLMVLLNAVSMASSTAPAKITTEIAAPARRWLGHTTPWSPHLYPEPPMGVARIIQSNGQTFLEFQNSFTRMESTLDLTLVLSPSAVPSPQVFRTGAVHLGPLQWTAGTQRYALPAEIDVEQYQSVVIWCPDLYLIVGYTPLKNS